MNFSFTLEELLRQAKKLKGKTVDFLLKHKEFDSGKGAIGNIIEREGFGIANNNESRPDFPELGVELKVLPLKRDTKNRLTVKERTKICSINYMNLINEKWVSSHAKNKLNKILFIFYEYNQKNPRHSKVIDYYLFNLDESDEPLLKSDWERTKREVELGRAHSLSESQNVVLAASRSGAGKLPESKWPEQPNQRIQKNARQRAFSLKPSFTKTLWHEVHYKNSLDKIIDKYKYSDAEGLENYILGQLNKWQGQSIAEFAKHHNIKKMTGKASNAFILRSALGFFDKKKQLKEIMQLGLSVKTVPCRSSDLFPWESMSFPYQPLGEIINEDRFDESEFYTYLQGFLFIPLLRDKREKQNSSTITLGKSVIWHPTHDELEDIQEEWEQIRNVIRDDLRVWKKVTNNKKGFVQKNNIPGESDTKYIHMRPHGRDSNDLDDSIKVKITKQSFWFNKSFIQKLISG
jgi:DNA mismatch repair endonuclease MutH